MAIEIYNTSTDWLVAMRTIEPNGSFIDKAAIELKIIEDVETCKKLLKVSQMMSKRQIIKSSKKTMTKKVKSKVPVKEINVEAEKVIVASTSPVEEEIVVAQASVVHGVDEKIVQAALSKVAEAATWASSIKRLCRVRDHECSVVHRNKRRKTDLTLSEAERFEESYLNTIDIPQWSVGFLRAHDMEYVDE
jgi:hypothetical protein